MTTPTEQQKEEIAKMVMNIPIKYWRTMSSNDDGFVCPSYIPQCHIKIIKSDNSGYYHVIVDGYLISMEAPLDIHTKFDSLIRKDKEKQKIFDEKKIAKIHKLLTKKNSPK